MLIKCNRKNNKTTAITKKPEQILYMKRRSVCVQSSQQDINSAANSSAKEKYLDDWNSELEHSEVCFWNGKAKKLVKLISWNFKICYLLNADGISIIKVFFFCWRIGCWINILMGTLNADASLLLRMLHVKINQNLNSSPHFEIDARVTILKFQKIWDNQNVDLGLSSNFC